MVPALEEIDPVLLNQVDEPMLLRQSAGPGSGVQILQRLRLADAGKRIAENGLDQIERPQGDIAVNLHPEDEKPRRAA